MIDNEFGPSPASAIAKQVALFSQAPNLWLSMKKTKSIAAVNLFSATLWQSERANPAVNHAISGTSPASTPEGPNSFVLRSLVKGFNQRQPVSKSKLGKPNETL